jgi:hypothetical protein
MLHQTQVYQPKALDTIQNLEKTTQDTDHMLMEQVNILINCLKSTRLLDGILSVANEHSFIDLGTIKAIILKGLDGQ